MLIPRAVFRISKGAAKHSRRYAITGVRVERGEGSTCYAVVTDGRKQIIAEWSDEEASHDFPPVLGSPPGKFKPKEGVVVSREQWDEAGKAIPGARITRHNPVLANCHLDEGAIIAYRKKHPKGNSCPVRMANYMSPKGWYNHDGMHEGAFPSWRDVVPNYRTDATSVREAVQIGLNPKLLAECCKLVEWLGTNEEFKGALVTVPIEDRRVVTIEGRSAESGVTCKAIINPIGGTVQGIRQHIGGGRKRN